MLRQAKLETLSQILNQDEAKRSFKHHRRCFSPLTDSNIYEHSSACCIHSQVEPHIVLGSVNKNYKMMI